MSQIIGIYGITDRFDHPYPAYVHDHNVTLMEDGMIKGYVHLERHSRRKYDNRLGQYIEELLLEGTWDVQPDAQWVFVNTFVGNDFQSRGGRLRFELQAKPQIHVEGQRGWGWWQYAAWEGREINAYMLSHELAHIGACLPFYGAFKDNSLLVHFDGGASQSNFSAFLYREGEVNPLAHHWELSHLSKFYNDHALTFRILKSSPGMHTSVPGKLMGYAALGNYRPELVPWLVAHDYFRMIWKNEAYFYRAAEKQWGWQGSLDDQHDPFLLDVAATLQEIFIQGILQTLQQLQEIHQADFLYYSGGCALNILANQRILDRGLFQEVFIPPCCSDSGLSLGAVAWMSWQQGRAVAKHSPYLNEWLPIERVDYTPEDIQSVGKLLV
ncbi:MAG: carbamoyltransferase N-terminal domain-containing protein, partial [Bacteroidota bacterium]